LTQLRWAKSARAMGARHGHPEALEFLARSSGDRERLGLAPPAILARAGVVIERQYLGLPASDRRQITKVVRTIRGETAAPRNRHLGAAFRGLRGLK
jgi:hypothetical protein